MIFDGKAFAKEKEEDLKNKIAKLREKNIFPKLVSILADDSKESALYVSLKEKFSQRIGATYEIHSFAEGEIDQVIEDIKKANQDRSVHGIMVQLPVMGEEKILPAISPLKDVDCLTEENLGLVLKGEPRFLPATVKAVIEILRSGKCEVGSVSARPPASSLAGEVGRGGGDGKWEDKWLVGKNVCIVGASIIVGKPLAIILSDAGATVTLCRSTTVNLPEFTREADILISATGAVELIKKDMVKDGAIVIDVGISKLLREGKFRVVGDVSEEVASKASFITPVPGGVGPVTVACLFENLLSAVV